MNRHRRNELLHNMEKASCVGKNVYFSQREADDKAALSSFYSREVLHGYQCPFCALWHMGHRKSRMRLESERELKQYEFDSTQKRDIDFC
jgi:hypothetical protein